MYPSDQKGQCLICFSSLDDDCTLYTLLFHPPICQDCLHSFVETSGNFCLENIPMTILYQYNDFFKKLLFDFKGKGDYALKDTFLTNHVASLKRQYASHVIVVAPSSDQDNIRRDFCPNLSIARTFSQDIFTGITKKNFYKQTSQAKRELVKDVLKISGGNRLKNRKVLIFDDVITSGSTIKAMIGLLSPYKPESIEILIMASSNPDRFLDKKSLAGRFKLLQSPR